MMKSFFKKLAFVMALAMVLTSAAPAGAVFAAEAGITLQNDKTTVVTEYDLAVGAEVDFRFEGAPKDWKTTFAWTSSNDDVATVNKAGVVKGIADGVAVITITAGADGSYEHTVKVTVGKGEVTNTFVLDQTTTDDITLTFDEAKLVTIEDVKVNQLYAADVKIEIPVKEVTVNGNVATVALYSELEHEAVYEVEYKGEVETFTASIGAVDSVAFNYTSIDVNKPSLKYPGIAYVSTDDEPVEVKLSLVLYDAAGVDVTKAYDLNEFDVEYEVAVENENYDLVDDVITFEKASAATVKLLVEWIDEEGVEYSKPFAAVVRATKRPTLTLDYVAGGFISESNTDRIYDFTDNPWGYYWSTGKYSTTYTLRADGANDNIQFVAKLYDNRGNTILTSGTKAWTSSPHGYFVFKSSNENLFSIDSESGLITPDGEKTGTGSVLVYFVNNEDETEKEVFVGSTKITFKAAPYPTKYTITNTSLSTVNVGNYTTGSFVMQVTDQYGKGIDLTNGISDINVEASSESNPVALSVSRDSNTAGKYYISFDGKAFDLDNHNYATFKYKVSVDKEENVKVSTGTTSISVKVYDVNEYYQQLQKALNKTTTATKTPSKYYYTVDVGTYGYKDVDLRVAQYKDLSSGEAPNTKAVEKQTAITVYYVSSNGYKLEQVCSGNLKERLDKQTTGTAGIIYYSFAYPSKNAKNYTVTDPDDDGTDAFLYTFNDATAGVAEGTTTEKTDAFYATTGSYKVTLYTTKSVTNNTLVKLGDYVINVTNSEPVKGAITATVNDSTVLGLSSMIANEADVIEFLETERNEYGTRYVTFNYMHRSNFYNNFYGDDVADVKTNIPLGHKVEDVVWSTSTSNDTFKLKVKYAIVSYYVDTPDGSKILLTTKVNINKTFTEQED